MYEKIILKTLKKIYEYSNRYLKILFNRLRIIIYLLTFKTPERIRWRLRVEIWRSEIWPVNIINSLQTHYIKQNSSISFVFSNMKLLQIRTKQLFCLMLHRINRLIIGKKKEINETYIGRKKNLIDCTK